MELKTIIMAIAYSVIAVKILSVLYKIGDGYTNLVTLDGFSDGDKLGFWDRIRFKNDIPIRWKDDKEKKDVCKL